MQYAYLQTGSADLAQAIADEAKTIRRDELSPGFEGYYDYDDAEAGLSAPACVTRP